METNEEKRMEINEERGMTWFNHWEKQSANYLPWENIVSLNFILVYENKEILAFLYEWAKMRRNAEIKFLSESTKMRKNICENDKCTKQ